MKRICQWLWIRCLEGVPLFEESALCVSILYLFSGACSTVAWCVCVSVQCISQHICACLVCIHVPAQLTWDTSAQTIALFLHSIIIPSFCLFLPVFCRFCNIHCFKVFLRLWTCMESRSIHIHIHAETFCSKCEVTSVLSSVVHSKLYYKFLGPLILLFLLTSIMHFSSHEIPA